MKPLNKCVMLSDCTQGERREATRYWDIHKVTGNSSLLLHLLTGAVDIVTDEEITSIREAFASGNINLLPLALRRSLEDRGYIADPASEQAFIDMLAERHQKQLAQKPIEFFITTTFGCPVGCTYCFEGELTYRTRGTVITSEQVSSAFRCMVAIKEMTNRPVREIVLFGGEPLLPKTKNAVHEILVLASDSGYKITVCTSGIFCRDFVPLFDKFSNTVALVRVTIDGPREYHDSLRTLPKAFDRAVEGIEALLVRGLRVMIRTNVGKQNLELLPDLANFFLARGWLHNELFDPIIASVKDRACVGDKGAILREDEFAVRLLQMRAEHESVRSLRPVNVFMSLRHLAANLGHLEGIVQLKEAVVPLETIKFHGCGATDGTLYVFGSDNCVYACTEAIGKSALSMGTYHPSFNLDTKRLQRWQGWHKYRIPKCRECKYLRIEHSKM